MKKIITASVFAVISTSSFAQLNSMEFRDCFVKAVNESIVDLKANGKKSQKKRICDELSQKTIDRITEKLTIVEDGQLKYYSAESMGKERMVDVYDYLKNDMDCYGNAIEGQDGALVGAIINSRSYNRNLKLVDRALDRMAGQDLWGKFFGTSDIYKTLDELDLSYCK